jgi:hypothetical protein
VPGSTTADRDWLESITPEWERFLGPRSAGVAGRILEVYYWHRVPITIHVERIVAYPDDAAAGKPQVVGKPLAEPAPSRPAAARRRGSTPPRWRLTPGGCRTRFWGWCGSDDIPEIVPAHRLPRSKLAFILASGSIAFAMKKARGAAVAPQRAS